MESLLGNLKKGLIFVVSAPAGTGKTTLARMLIDEFPCVKESISCATRKPRKGEIADVDYHFMENDEFESKVKAGEFLEHAEVFGNHYGTLNTSIEKNLKNGEHVILVIDTDGAMQLKKQKTDAVFIFIKPPSMGELRARLFNRKTENEELIEERLKRAEHEIEMAPQYDYVIVNDNLHRAYEILRSIFIAEEHKTERINGRSYDK
ncbi:MAG: guanylate kinase [Simkaniaceae bacterium]|nr:guanylate kinase [Candidatus Sacchlamyda saccharinae]